MLIRDSSPIRITDCLKFHLENTVVHRTAFDGSFFTLSNGIVVVFTVDVTQEHRILLFKTGGPLRFLSSLSFIIVALLHRPSSAVSMPPVSSR